MTRGRVDEPRRLASGKDPAGRLLREADRAFRSQLSPELAWKRFQSRRQRRWVLSFAILAAGTSLVVAITRHQLSVQNQNEAPTLVAERVPAPQRSVVPDPTAVVERRIAPPSSALARSPVRAPASRKGGAPLRVEPLTVPVEPPTAPVEPLTEATCRAWMSRARPERAVDCYQSIAREAGLGAEVALYEAARLSAEALADAPRALLLLDQHSARFPSSVLRVEVEWLKIRSLERIGRLDEALAASEVLLDSTAGRSLAPKLHLLRGRIYADARGDCALALPEYVALLGEPGAAGDEAEFKRAQCLERLQRPDEARAAYQRYLGRADARSAEVAQARLNAISNPASSLEGQP
jgi:tetratricopeptide (TPR) repeat protein